MTATATAKSRRARLVSTICLTLLICSNTWAETVNTTQAALPTYSAGVSQLSNGTHPNGEYRIIGSDPYWVIALGGDSKSDSKSDSGSQRVLQFTLQISDAQDSNEHVPVEIFFRKDSHDDKFRFDPNYRIKLRIPRNTVEIFQVPLPATIDLSAQSSLRLDIDACLACTIKLSNMLQLKSLDSKTLSENVPAIGLIQAVHIYNRILQLDGQGLTVDSNSWELHDIERQAEQLTLTGDDPFLVARNLDVVTDSLGGILVEIDAPINQHEVYDFQVFYATEQHKFIELASSIVRVAPQQRVNAQANRLKFLIPLRFLSEQTPLVKLLSDLRIDFARHSLFTKQSTIAGKWSVPQVRLVNKTELAELSEFIPAQLVHSKLQSAGKRQTLFGIFAKISRDMGFLLSYLLLLIATMVTVYRRLKTVV